jgi:hypothetical protein
MFAKYVTCVVFLLLSPLSLPAFEVVTIHPDVAAVDEVVSIIGGPFDSGFRLQIAGLLTPFELNDPRHLTFRVPALDPGVYPLLLSASPPGEEQAFTLQVVVPPPEIVSLTPARVDECYDAGEHMITLRGRHLLSTARLLINGLAIPFEWHNAEEIVFEAPRLTAGAYGVQVVNPDGRKSLPQSLEFSNAPEIFSVSRGDDFVNYYQLVIRGKNFFQQSLLVVSDYPTSLPDFPPRQRAVSGQALHTQQQQGLHLRQEVVSYQDCRTLVYNRYPLSGAERQVKLWVSNPDGKQTPPYEVLVP